MVMKYRILFWIVLIGCSGCRYGEMVVESDGDLYQQGKSIQKIISINPELEVFASRKEGAKLVEISTMKEAEIHSATRG